MLLVRLSLSERVRWCLVSVNLVLGFWLLALGFWSLGQRCAVLSAQAGS